MGKLPQVAVVFATAPPVDPHIIIAFDAGMRSDRLLTSGLVLTGTRRPMDYRPIIRGIGGGHGATGASEAFISTCGFIDCNVSYASGYRDVPWQG